MVSSIKCSGQRRGRRSGTGVLAGLFAGMLGLFGWAGGRAEAEPAGSPEGAAKTVLLELFTSEGCSSCPPADALLARLAAKGPSGGVAVIALEWHVDYWNYLGWADPFSAASSTERQEQYGRTLGSGRVYTPQLVIDGRAETVGSSEGRARALIEQAGAQKKASLVLQRHGDSLSLSVKDVPASGAGVELFLAITEEGLFTAVPRGENAGRTLPHGPVVRSLRKLQRLQADSLELTTELTLDSHWKREKLHAVAFLQRVGSGEIVGATQIGLGGS